MVGSSNPGIFGLPNQPLEDVGHGTEIQTAANVFLRAESKTRQILAPTAAGQVVQLAPNLAPTPFGLLSVFRNITALPSQLVDALQVVRGWVMPGSSASIWLDDNTSAPIPAKEGTYRIQTGDVTRDNGLYWFGALEAVTASGTAVSSVSVALGNRFGIIGYFNGTSYLLRGYDLSDGLLVLGATSTLVTSANVNVASNAAQIDCGAVNATEALFVYTIAGGGDTNVVTVDLNTSTLALTINTLQQVDSGPTTPGGISCSLISSALAFVTYGSSTYLKCVTVSISGGACTVNTPAQISGSAVTGASSKVLSAVLAHVQFTPTSTTTSIVRVVLSGSTVTPGTPVVVTNRAAGGVSAGNGYCDLGKLSAASSWSVLEDNSGTHIIYGEVYTDTGSTISVTETQLTQGGTGAGSDEERLQSFAISDASNSGIVTKLGGSGLLVSFNIARAAGTTVGLSATLQQTPNFAAIPGNSATTQLPNATFTRIRFSSGIGMYHARKTTSSILILQPMAIA